MLTVALTAAHHDPGVLARGEGAALLSPLGDLAGAVQTQTYQHVEHRDQRHRRQEEQERGHEEGVGHYQVLHRTGGVLLAHYVAIVVVQVD